jgi:hypothetical protein
MEESTESYLVYAACNKVLTARLAFRRVYRRWLWAFRRAAPWNYHAQQPFQKRQAVCIHLVL